MTEERYARTNKAFTFWPTSPAAPSWIRKKFLPGTIVVVEHVVNDVGLLLVHVRNTTYRYWLWPTDLAPVSALEMLALEASDDEIQEAP